MNILKAKQHDGSVPLLQRKKRQIIYPDSDGKRMADNTKQYNWIVKIKENLERLFDDEANVFVAGDLLWYPEEGDNKTRMAPDAMVVFGRPKGDRGSYRMWEEDNIAPQVVFEILSPGNRKAEMERKFAFYERYGVEEYYVYDPDRILLKGWLRSGGRLRLIDADRMRQWTSPLLKIRFDLRKDDLHVFGQDGKAFLTLAETTQQYERNLQVARKLAETEKKRAEQLAARLRELGIDPEQV
jgi:Uma2 family endonuclease